SPPDSSNSRASSSISWSQSGNISLLLPQRQEKAPALTAGALANPDGMSRHLSAPLLALPALLLSPRTLALESGRLPAAAAVTSTRTTGAALAQHLVFGHFPSRTYPRY